MEEIDSTNEEARRLSSEGGSEGTVVIAGSQVKGRGRFRRRWVSPPGGIYLSIILKPYVNSSKLPLITYISSLAGIRTIRGLTKLGASLKWPNDIVISGKKAGGILCETVKRTIVAGIGINLNTNLSLFPKTLKKQVTSVRFELGAQIDQDKFIKILLEEFDKLYRSFLLRKYNEIITEWSGLCETLGREIKIETARGHVKGIAESIGSEGELNLRSSDGKIKKVHSGNVIKVEYL